jgi:hypothetical protein
MELTMRTIVVLLILLVATLVFASIILGWGSESNTWLHNFLKPFQDIITGK